jgi:predicted metal-dependent peptidase
METISYDEILKKIRVEFLFEHPFLSVLALSIETVFASNSYSAFQTDGVTLSIDSDRLERYTAREIKYLYAHTLLHIVLKHPQRCRERDSKLWNMSCDLVVNAILSPILESPSDEIVDKRFIECSAEEVYAKLDAKNYNYSERKLDIYKPKESTQKLDSIIIQALSIAKKSQNRYRGLEVEIANLIEPDIDISNILREFLISSLFEKRETYSRANRKFIHKGLYLAGYESSREFADIYVALDSSSSVSLDEYRKFLAVIKEICQSLYEYSVVVVPFDIEVKEDNIVKFDSFNPVDEESFFIVKSDGGTDFNKALLYLQERMSRDSLLIVLSDGEFEIGRDLGVNTLFIITQNRNLKKFKSYGRVVQFKI